MATRDLVYLLEALLLELYYCCVVVVGCSDDEPSQDSTDRENEGG